MSSLLVHELCSQCLVIKFYPFPVRRLKEDSLGFSSGMTPSCEIRVIAKLREFVWEYLHMRGNMHFRKAYLLLFQVSQSLWMSCP
nr:uncharacterized protein LOC131771295 isoform X2 [Pocillopora verrucosa]